MSRTALGLTLLVGALVVRTGRTPDPLPATAPPTEFSAERALAHNRIIAERPHPTGSEQHARVRAYIVAQLEALGLEPQLQSATAVGTRYPVAGRVVNVLARIPGRSPGGKAVLIAAHYDGVWAAPAAGDDGSSASALLETLRALRAGAPLDHDVIALFSDAEESGLLGAAAFVREHPWARDAEVVLDFEARGTEGRSVMFETGAGNLDVVRVLRTVPDVTAGSLLVTVYRSMPNDTDLSELALLGKPALNFAFVDGVERYHTAHDDIAHLSAGTLQHHGMQMLALARAFGNGPLPRPVTGDAIFFDAPLVGLVVYPESWALPIALLVTLLVAAVVVRAVRREAKWGRGMSLGLVGMLVATGVCGFMSLKIGAGLDALHAARGWDGAPSWRGVYAAALAVLAIAVAAAIWALVRRWAGALTLHAGALIAWTVLVILATLRVPGASYLFSIPVGAVALGVLTGGRGALAARWLATIVACAVLVPVTFTTGAYTLPLNGPGGIATGALVSMIAWLLAPHLETMRGDRRWRSAGLLALASLAVFAYGAATVRRSDRYPTVANLSHVTNIDADSAWLVAPLQTARDGSYAAEALGASRRTLRSVADADSAMRWLYDVRALSPAMAARGTPRTDAEAPEAAVIADSIVNDTRHLSVRFTAPRGTLSYAVHGAAFVRALSVDGRALDSARYRAVPKTLSVPFTAPPDSGFVVVLELPRDSTAELHLTATSPGLPAKPGVDVPARKAGVVPVQNGDVTIRYRRVRLP